MNYIDWQSQIEATRREMAANIAQALYSDNQLLKEMKKNMKPPTFRQRVSAFLGRAHDAWMVLTGRLDPYDGY